MINIINFIQHWFGAESEKYWEQIELEVCWGFQIQPGIKWKEGLSEQQLNDFQKKLRLQFPESLKNFYKMMNGLDKPGLNNNGNEKDVEFSPTFYSYPDDIEKMKSKIQWILEDNAVTNEAIRELNIPSIVPYYAHRFLIIDKEELVLSMYGSDIIFWADNLSKGVATDIFHNRYKVDTVKVDANSF
ncbi:MAG TPA: SMI1/KNR4 family protein [Puia sp.]|nr:SMI1/KNR4 family protein [Puia sp.]